MILHTGGLADGEISTRSRSFSRAMSCACCGGTMPTCFPSESIKRTSGMPRIMSLILDSGSAGFRSNLENRLGGQIRTSSWLFLEGAPSTAPRLQSQRARGDQSVRTGDEFLDGLDRLVASAALPHGHGPIRRFLFADHEHERDFHQLRVADLRAELLVRLVDLHPQPRRAQLRLDLVRVVD